MGVSFKRCPHPFCLGGSQYNHWKRRRTLWRVAPWTGGQPPGNQVLIFGGDMHCIKIGWIDFWPASFCKFLAVTANKKLRCLRASIASNREVLIGSFEKPGWILRCLGFVWVKFRLVVLAECCFQSSLYLLHHSVVHAAFAGRELYTTRWCCCDQRSKGVRMMSEMRRQSGTCFGRGREGGCQKRFPRDKSLTVKACTLLCECAWPSSFSRSEPRRQSGYRSVTMKTCRLHYGYAWPPSFAGVSHVQSFIAHSMYGHCYPGVCWGSSTLWGWSTNFQLGVALQLRHNAKTSHGRWVTVPQALRATLVQCWSSRIQMGASPAHGGCPRTGMSDGGYADALGFLCSSMLHVDAGSIGGARGRIPISCWPMDHIITLPSDSAHLYQIHDCSQGHGLDPRPRRRCYIAARLGICCLRPVGWRDAILSTLCESSTCWFHIASQSRKSFLSETSICAAPRTGWCMRATADSS